MNLLVAIISYTSISLQLNDNNKESEIIEIYSSLNIAVN